MATKYMSLEKELFTYENEYQQNLKTKIPVFVRIKGKAFGTFTRGFQKPFDKIFANSMQRTMKSLCETTQGCVFGYSASDEIILLLTDYKHWNSVPWLNYNVDLINSTIAATASFEFNKAFRDEVMKLKAENANEDYAVYESAMQSFAILTSNCFNVPEDRVCDIICWLQCDTRRHAIQKLAKLYIDRKTLIGLCNDEIIDMLNRHHDIDWDSMPNAFKIGSACKKELHNNKLVWIIDAEMPMLQDGNKKYLTDILSSIKED